MLKLVEKTATCAATVIAIERAAATAGLKAWLSRMVTALFRATVVNCPKRVQPVNESIYLKVVRSSVERLNVQAG